MKKGFTLIELLAVIAILGILSIIVVPNALEAYQNSLKKAMQVQESNIVDAAKLYLEDYCSNKISSDYICPDNYINDGYMCLSELQSPSSPLASDNDGYMKSVLFKKDYCKGVIVFSEHTLKSYKDAKTYLYCGDSDKYSYVTDENFNASQYTKCGIENAVGNGETNINTCKDIADSCASMSALCNNTAYYDVMTQNCPVT